MSGENTGKGPLEYKRGGQWFKGGLMYGNGCSFHDDCFTCPFLACRYDRPGVVTEYRRQQAAERKQQAKDREAAMVRQGMTLVSVGRTLGLSQYRLRVYLKEELG